MTSTATAAVEVKSAYRVFEILELFAVDRAPRRLIQIARRMRYPVSSTRALLKTMVECGYVVFDPHTGTYFPSVRVHQLAARLHGFLWPLPEQRSRVDAAKRA